MHAYWFAPLLVHTSEAFRPAIRHRDAISVSSVNGTSNVASSINPSSAPSPASISPQNAATTSIAIATLSTNSSTADGNPTTGTCCYMSARYVGVNTWYSKHIEVTVATVVTTWIQYNNTIIPVNSTTSRINTTAPFIGIHTYGATITSLPSSIPTNLLPSYASMYGYTIIGETGIQQTDLVIQSPTPFFEYREIDLDTSWGCPSFTVYTNFTRSYQEWLDNGSRTWTTTVLPTYTDTVFPSLGDPLQYPQHNAQLKTAVVEPFPDGDYSNFDYKAWVSKNGGVAMNPGDPFYLALSGLPTFLAGLPWVKSDFPSIASCTNLGGGGQPTVHIPVTQLTTTQHYTVTIAGTLTPASHTLTMQHTSAAQSLPGPALTIPLSTATQATSPIDSVSSAEISQKTGSMASHEVPASSQGGSGRNSYSSTYMVGSDHANPSHSTRSKDTESDIASTASLSTVNIGDIIASVIHMSPGETQSKGPHEHTSSPDGNQAASNGMTMTEVLTQHVTTISSSGLAVTTLSTLEVASLPPLPPGASYVSEPMKSLPSSSAGIGENPTTAIVIEGEMTVSHDGTAMSTVSYKTTIAVLPVLESTHGVNGKMTTELLTEYITTVSSDGAAVTTLESWGIETALPLSSIDQNSGSAVRGHSTGRNTLSSGAANSTATTRLPAIVTTSSISSEGTNLPSTGTTDSNTGQTSSRVGSAASRCDISIVRGLILMVGWALIFRRGHM